MKAKLYTGINIQYPISQLILNGAKSVETRTYPIPERLIGEELAIIETPGPTGKFKSRIVGLIVFGKSFQYKTLGDFTKDQSRHQVTADSKWAWNPKKEKWGWPILKITKLKKEIPLKKRSGIVYSKGIEL